MSEEIKPQEPSDLRTSQHKNPQDITASKREDKLFYSRYFRHPQKIYNPEDSHRIFQEHPLDKYHKDISQLKPVSFASPHPLLPDRSYVVVDEKVSYGKPLTPFELEQLRIKRRQEPEVVTWGKNHLNLKLATPERRYASVPKRTEVVVLPERRNGPFVKFIQNGDTFVIPQKRGLILENSPSVVLLADHNRSVIVEKKNDAILVPERKTVIEKKDDALVTPEKNKDSDNEKKKKKKERQAENKKDVKADKKKYLLLYIKNDQQGFQIKKQESAPEIKKKESLPEKKEDNIVSSPQKNSKVEANPEKKDPNFEIKPAQRDKIEIQEERATRKFCSCFASDDYNNRDFFVPNV